MTSTAGPTAGQTTESGRDHRTVDFRFAPTTTWTAICRPDDPHKTLVREDGALLYDLVADRNTWCFGRVVAFGLRTDLKPIGIEQRTEDARTPIVRTTVRYPHATLALTTFAHRDDAGRRFDVVLWDLRVAEDAGECLAQVLVTARERTRLFTGPAAAAHDIYAVDLQAVPLTSVIAAIHADILGETPAALPGGELAFRSTPLPLEPVPTPGFDPIPTLATAATPVPAGGRLRGAFVFPLAKADLDGVDLAWADAALAAERAFWAGYPLLRLAIEIPDPAVMEMVTACARNIVQAREIVDGLPEFRVGSAIFRGLWVVDGHFLLEAAQYLGYRDEAAAGLDVLLRRVHADGAIAEMPFHIKETAIALATFVRQCELLGDDDRLRRLWPTVRNGIAYIEALRRDAYALPADSPAYGLLPPAFADGGIAGRRAEYTSTYWTLAGLKITAAAARRLGYAQDADRTQRMFDALMVDFRAHAARDVRELPDGTPYLSAAMPGSGDHTWIADYPGAPPVWRQIYPQTGTWAFAQAVYPGEVFAPDDPLVRDFLTLLDAVDDEQGIPTNTAFWTYRMVWTYSASFSAHAWLAAGRPDKAIDYLYAFANHAAPTRVWREEQPLVDAHTLLLSGDMPHNWASAEFIRLVRHLLVFERGESLELLPGLPAGWIVPDRPLRLERTPTRFGPVTLRLRGDGSGEVQIEVERDTAWPRRPNPVLLHLPAGWRFLAANAGGRAFPHSTRPDGAIALPDAARVTVRLGRQE